MGNIKPLGYRPYLVLNAGEIAREGSTQPTNVLPVFIGQDGTHIREILQQIEPQVTETGNLTGIGEKVINHYGLKVHSLGCD